KLARVVHARARRGVDLDQVHEPALVDRGAGSTYAARLRHDAGVAVQSLGEQTRNRGLADAPGTGEQIGVMQAILLEGVRERLYDMRLADEFFEPPWPPLQRQNRVTHACLSSGRFEVRASPTPAPNRAATAAPFRA